MNLILQIWGGAAYLLNKILLSTAEGKPNNQRIKIWGWALYLIGVPAWVIILVSDGDWIAATIEVGGVPSMLLGLVVAARNLDSPPKQLDRISMIFAYVLLAVGTIYSMIDYGGIRQLSQVLEIGVMAGFLGGTYLLAKMNRAGWLLFMVMNISMGLLMLLRGNYILALQQLVSLLFVLSGYIRSTRSVAQPA